MEIQKTGRRAFSIWFDRGTKSVSLHAGRKEWKPRLCFHENGGRRKRDDKCFDCSLIIGTWVFGYTNWDLQKRRIARQNTKEGQALRTTGQTRH